ncbi:fasciclin domain-containing protein [Pseudonocardia hydrocarbonoxydans]|uniref:fasciclin domain-containing protein n=1 Tax=Pseudonocardia hydrocarbonoxydans TaxID=76726 RepID=UPI0011417BD4|nr:fasciclin domain-containing protein [Pseudonocardia hydrocarbonoxydans]
MRKIQRLAAVGAMAALTVALGACSSSETPSAEAPASSAPSAAASSEMQMSSDGVTTIEDIFGPACDQVPTEGEGSAQGMIDDPVATAASNNPLLSTLVTAVGAVDGLADTLNAAPALTVFAPFNGAFEALPAGTVETLVANPDQLAPILQGHVSSTRYDAAGLVEAGTVDVLSGGTVTIGGTADAPTFDGGNGTAATNLCGNVPTANATVFVIDTILMPAA